jgi:hypothetical protein
MYEALKSANNSPAQWGAEFVEWCPLAVQLGYATWEASCTEHNLRPISRDDFRAGAENTLLLARRAGTLLTPDGTAVSSDDLFAAYEPVCSIVGDFVAKCDAELLYTWLSGELVKIAGDDVGLLARVLYPPYVSDRKPRTVAALRVLKETNRATQPEYERYIIVN